MSVKNRVAVWGAFMAAFLPLVVFSGGCAPGLGNRLKLEMIEDTEILPLSSELSGSGTRVNVLQFQDVRTIEAVAQIDGRLIKPEGSVVMTVQRAFESQLKKNGIQLSLFDAPGLRGEINEWRVFVTPGFPSSSLEAVATIHVELLDGAEQIVHRSEYSGEFRQQHPFMGESTVSSALAKAMGYAIQEALSDPVLINRLATLQARRQ